MKGNMKDQILRSFCVLFIGVIYLCIVTQATAPQLAGVDGKSLFRSLRASHCQEDCSSATIRPVCGSDGNTYQSRCQLKRAKKCDGRKVKVRKRGRCSDADNGGRNYDGSKKCLVERSEAIEAARLAKSAVFVPKCNLDGTFAEIQCHSATGYCWCVTKYGRHIPATSVKDRQPRCGNKRGKRRKPKRRKKKRRVCTREDREQFNSDLVGEFTQEYNRIKNSQHSAQPEPMVSEVQMEERERRTVEWKFSQLDRDKDNILRFKEIRSFVRMVKKLIKPKACAKKFLKFCDSNNNRRIELSEWTLCLGVDIKYGRTTEAPLERPKIQDSPFASRIRNPGFTLSTREPKRKDRKRPDKSYTKKCEEERDQALNHHSQEPNANIYIPRCEADGKWKKAQCHKATEYCWCVEEETGMPIPGTSTHRVEPNCSISEDRPMKGESHKGCPYSQKRRFLVDLMTDLTEEMSKSNSTIHRPTDPTLSTREVVARWKLATLDVNRNGILERKEWKKLRKTNLKNKRYPRKCRRNFLRYCDADSNQKVTLEEWKECLGLNRQDNYSILPTNNRRGKKNPFINQLT